MACQIDGGIGADVSIKDCELTDCACSLARNWSYTSACVSRSLQIVVMAKKIWMLRRVCAVNSGFANERQRYCSPQVPSSIRFGNNAAIAAVSRAAWRLQLRVACHELSSLNSSSLIPKFKLRSMRGRELVCAAWRMFLKPEVV